MAQWEYHTIAQETALTDGQLNQLGGLGWEMAGIVDAQGCHVYHFKRLVEAASVAALEKPDCDCHLVHTYLRHTKGMDSMHCVICGRGWERQEFEQGGYTWSRIVPEGTPLTPPEIVSH